VPTAHPTASLRSAFLAGRHGTRNSARGRWDAVSWFLRTARAAAGRLPVYLLALPAGRHL